MKVYDIIIVGAGPIGLCCAIEAQKAGLDYLVIEKGVLVNSVFNFPTNMTFFSTSNLLEIGDVPFISHGDKPTRSESLEYFRRVMETWDLNIIFYEEVEWIEKNDDDLFETITCDETYYSKRIIIATGFYDNYRPLNVPGEELAKVKHYYDEPHHYVGQRIIIVGGGNSACDVALETYYKGAEVTMVIRKPEIKPTVKYWIRPNIINRIKEGSIKAHFNSRVVEILDNEVIIETPDGGMSIPNDFVLAMTGYKPDYDFFVRCGLQFSKDKAKRPVHNPETLETNIKGMYIAGVIAAGMQTSELFIENTRVHAGIIVSEIKKQIQVGT
jgi:bacillithiol disulfide reductase